MTFDELKKLCKGDPEAALRYALEIKREDPVLFWASVFAYYRQHHDESAMDRYGVIGVEEMEREWK